MSKKPVMLVILDGFGWREETADNAVALARKPNFDRLWAESPHGFLTTCGRVVGLPEGQMGNSEVGHLNIGAGRGAFASAPGGGAGGDFGRGGGASGGSCLAGWAGYAAAKWC